MISASWDSLIEATCELPPAFNAGEVGVLGAVVELVGRVAELGGLAGVVLAGLAGVVLVRLEADEVVEVVDLAGVLGFGVAVFGLGAAVLEGFAVLGLVVVVVVLEVGEMEGRDEGRLGALRRAAKAACCCFLSIAEPACVSTAIGVGCS